MNQKFLGLTIILDINVKMIKPLKFPEDKDWMEKDFLRIIARKDYKKKADEFNYTEIKITCTLKIKVINNILCPPVPHVIKS